MEKTSGKLEVQEIPLCDVHGELHIHLGGWVGGGGRRRMEKARELHQMYCAS